MVAFQRDQRGFTLIELMIVVALIAVLASLVIPTFFTESIRAKAETEITAVFAELRTKLGSYKVENGVYKGTTNDDSVLLPAGTLSRTKRPWDSGVAGLVDINFAPPETGAMCGYAVVANVGSNATGISTKAKTDFGMPDPPVANWYYIMARCNLDGGATVDTYAFTSSTNGAIQWKDFGQ